MLTFNQAIEFVGISQNGQTPQTGAHFAWKMGMMFLNK